LPLKDKWFSSLFSALPPRQWMQLKPEDKVSVSADSVLIPQGWLVKEYRHVLTTKGRKIEGDFRQSRHSELAEFYSDPFDYVLLVSEDGEYALELEKYENGTARIYATVYRPVSDISESTQFHRPYIVANNSAEAMLAKAEEAAPLEMPDIQADAPSESTITGLVQTSPVSVSNMLLREEVQEIAATALTTVKTATETQNFSGNMLACDVSLAANLIEEARRNKISMADVIRKVIDLPRKIDDRVYLPFDLTEEEHIALAKRYGLSESNTEAVQKKIVEELRQFAGLE